MECFLHLRFPGQADTTTRTSKQAQPAKRTIHPPRRHTPGRRAGISPGRDLELLLCSSQTIGDSMDWTKPGPNRASQVNPSQGRKSSWTELNELNGDTWPSYPKVNRTNFADKLVTRKLTCTELMPNHFVFWKIRPCKFANFSGPWDTQVVLNREASNDR